MYINGFEWGHLLTGRFWHVVGLCLLNIFFERSWYFAAPDRALWLEVSYDGIADDCLLHYGYRVSKAGYLFGSYILRYDIDEVPEIFKPKESHVN